MDLGNSVLFATLTLGACSGLSVAFFVAANLIWMNGAI